MKNLKTRGRRNRQRGQEGEREVCSILASALNLMPSSLQRNLGQERDGGSDIDLLPFQLQVKRRKNLAVHEFMKQAAEESGPNLPVVVMRADNKEWLAMMRLEDWAKLARGMIE